MNALESLDSISSVWGNWMLQMSWQVALLVLILSTLTWLWRQKSAVLLHTLWLLVLLRLVLPPAFAFPTGWSFWVLPAAGQSQATQPETAPDVAKTSPPVAQKTPPERIAVREDAAAAQPERLPTIPVVAADDGPVEEEPSAGPAAADAVPAPTPALAVRTLSSYLMLAWMGVAGTLLGLLFWGSVRVRRWVREAEPIDDPELYSLLQDCCEKLAITRLVELRNSESCTTPVVVGVRRPVILLPKEVLLRLNAAEMRAVLMHELNHIARGDAIVNLLQGVLGALYFFHPLVWWSNASLRRLREEACDELTVAALDGERRTYGEALVKVTEIFGYASPPLALGVLESVSPARARLGRILDPQLPPGTPISWRGAAGVLLLAAVLLPGAGGRTNADQPHDPGVQAAGNTDDSSNAALPAGSQAAAAKAAPAKAPLDGNGPLQYRWETGKSYAYSFHIEADEGETVETFTGTPSYVVRFAGANEIDITFNGRLMQSHKYKQGQRLPFGRPPRMRSPYSSFGGVGISGPGGSEHVLHLSERGQMQTVDGQSQLPYVLGNLSQLAIVPFPDDARGEWVETHNTTITLKPHDDDRFPFPRLPFGPFADRDDGERLEAHERIEYKRDELVQDKSGNTIVIRKKYDLKTTQSIDDKPRVELTGEAQITFDLVLGLPRSLTARFKLVQNTENTSHRIPITITAKLLSEEERARLETEKAALAERRPLGDDEVAAALAELRATDAGRVQTAAAKLERAVPLGRQSADVTRALALLLESNDALIRQAAAKALAVWCTKDQVPVLIKALDDESLSVSEPALEALGKLKDERTIEPAVRMLKARKHPSLAVTALTALGGIAENAVLPLLAEADADVRYDACQILRVIGGAKAIGPLTKAARDDENSLVRLVAGQALNEIEPKNP